MPYTIRIDLPRLDNIAAKIPDALVSALNSTAYVAKRDTEDAMRRSFDRPTPWVMSGIEYGRAGEKGNGAFQSSVFIKDKASKGDQFALKRVLLPEFDGGQRRYKMFEAALNHVGVLYDGEFVVPTRHAIRDAYGNVPRQWIVQIMSALRANYKAGYTANRSLASGRRFRARTGGDWIVPAKSGRYQRSKLKRGIYWRDDASRSLTMYFAFVRHAPSYKQRIDLRSIVRGAIRKEFWTKFNAKIR
jgi:hypothetical protein